VLLLFYLLSLARNNNLKEKAVVVQGISLFEHMPFDLLFTNNLNHFISIMLKLILDYYSGIIMITTTIIATAKG